MPADAQATSGATIRGTIYEDLSWDYSGVYAVLMSWDGLYVDETDVVDGAYEFTGVSAGSYKVLLSGAAELSTRWVRSSTDDAAPRKIVIGPGSTATVTLAELDLWPDYAAIFVDASPLPDWTGDTVCGAMMDADTYEIYAIDCVATGQQLILTPTGGSAVTIRFANAELRTVADWRNYKGSTYWYGNKLSNSVRSHFTLPRDGDDYWLFNWYFTDIDSGSPGFEAISWMGAARISTGFGDGSYRPLQDVTRRQMAYFMYRLAGEPDFPLPRTSPFTDVKKGDPGYEAIAWLDYAGVATGFGDGSYRPLDSVTRRQMAYFMYRYAGSPSFSSPKSNPYTDVRKTSPGYRAIAWMSVNDIATGFGDGSYRPLDGVTRRQMAYFMYRYWFSG